MRNKVKYSLRFKMLLVIVVATIASAAAAIYISYSTYSQTVDGYYKETLTNIASTAAALMDAEIIGEYATNREIDEEYNIMLERLCKIRENTGIRYLYVEKVEGNTAIAIMDTDKEEPMGFRESFDVSEGADVSSLEKGIPAFISNENGVWACSVFTPIRNAAGETVALVGADMSMDEVMHERHIFLIKVCIAILLVTVFAAIIMVTLINRIVVKPLNKLSYATTNFVSKKDGNISSIGENSFITQLEVRANDEIGELTNSVKIMEQEIKKYITDLTEVTAERERIGAELNIATQIQADLLPRIFPAFPERSEFDIYATMDPAKEVGGDFYDFFMVDENHLAMVMADVSGKGVPAALFMVIAKTLIKNWSQTLHSPKDILEKVNKQLCENNDAEMFVTTWLGIIDLSTGIIRAANAGHEYPVLKKADGDFELIKDKHGFVLAGMEMTRYREYEIKLEKKEVLYLYTDGVPEATNAENELYGTKRMLNVLNRNKNVSPEILLKRVREDIDKFVGEAPQFDDITMLAFELKETADEMRTEPTEASIGEVAEFVEAQLKEKEVSDKIIVKINIVVDEIYSNIVRCSGATQVIIRCTVKDGKISLVFMDDGIAYDPLKHSDPDITLTAEEREIGGLGIMMVKKFMDQLEYKYENGKNILTAIKELD